MIFHQTFARAVRARYPNVGKVEFVLGAMQVSHPSLTRTVQLKHQTYFPSPLQLIADDWVEPTYESVANFTFQPPSPFRNDTTDGFFQTFRIGVRRAPHVACHTS
jgi:hypothetical protein